MRLSRSTLVEQLGHAGAGGVIVLEAPAGYGKSWLLRKVWGSGALKLRGQLGPLTDLRTAGDLGQVIIDDAHLLSPAEIDRLATVIEFADERLRLIVAGRLVPDALHEVTELVDGTIIDAASLAVTAGEVRTEIGGRAASAADRLVEVADGCIRIVGAAAEQTSVEPGADPVALAARLVRTSSALVLQRLGPGDKAMTGLLARSPGVDRHLLEKLAGPGIVERLLTAGVPLRRQLTGGFDVAMASAYQAAPVERDAAIRLAGELVERDRPIDAIGLLLDAGDQDGAIRLFTGLDESLLETVEPRVLLGLLARLGTAVDRSPALLLVRSVATAAVGRLDDAGADIERAAALAQNADPPLRRRIDVEVAWALHSGGRSAEAVAAAELALVNLGAGEERTYARAYEVLAECASSSDVRADLQRAAECYRIAASAWESCGEDTRARNCRRDLAMGVLVSLGRLDESLAQFAQLLATPDLSDVERSWTVLGEAFVLVNAGRFDGAEERFVRVTDIGYLHDNPRMIAAAAWGRALIATCREDLDATIRWIATAENTALSDDDEILGVPFLCDVITALGALGEFDRAARYRDRAIERRAIFPDQVALASFVLDARLGILGDVDAQLANTAPAQWWRVQLVAAHAAARNGDLDLARRLLADSDRELIALGFDDASAFGERREQEAVRTLLHRAAAPAPEVPATRPRVAADTSRRLCVIGSPMVLQDGVTETEIPVGNPQRLVGVVVAHGGNATFDQLSDALWPDEEVETTRSRLRNVLLRLRRAAGDIVVRTANGVRLAPGVSCDLHDFERLAADAMSAARADPDLAGSLAADAVEIGTGAAFADFEYEEWSVTARRTVDARMISLLDLLSVQAQDSGDLAAAQALAERALRLDRYTDSRYVRLAELLSLQQRTAAAIAVLDDATEVAREMGGGVLSPEILQRRDELLRRAASG